MHSIIISLKSIILKPLSLFLRWGSKFVTDFIQPYTRLFLSCLEFWTLHFTFPHILILQFCFSPSYIDLGRATFLNALISFNLRCYTLQFKNQRGSPLKFHLISSRILLVVWELGVQITQEAHGFFDPVQEAFGPMSSTTAEAQVAVSLQQERAFPTKRKPTRLAQRLQ